MADIQPKNTNTIRVDQIKEKTGSAGVTLGASTVKITTAAIVPLTSGRDLGTTTSAEHFANIYAKNVIGSGQNLVLGTITAHDTDISAGNQIRFTVNNLSGNLVQHASQGGSITITRANTSLAQSVAGAVNAAGATIADATQLNSVFNNVTVVGAGQGVKLWSAENGSMIFVRNTSGANNLLVYPPDTSQQINAGALGAAVTIALGGGMGLFVKQTSTVWIGMEWAAPNA